jgi:hypothetical protein
MIDAGGIALMSKFRRLLNTSFGVAVRPTKRFSCGPKFWLGCSCDTIVASIGVKNNIGKIIPPFKYFQPFS